MKCRAFGIQRVLRSERSACGDQVSRDTPKLRIRKVLVLVHRKADAKSEHKDARRADESRGQGTVLHAFSSRKRHHESCGCARYARPWGTRINLLVTPECYGVSI